MWNLASLSVCFYFAFGALCRYCRYSREWGKIVPPGTRGKGAAKWNIWEMWSRNFGMGRKHTYSVIALVVSKDEPIIKKKKKKKDSLRVVEYYEVTGKAEYRASLEGYARRDLLKSIFIFIQSHTIPFFYILPFSRSPTET